MNPLMNSGLSASMIPIVNPMGNSMSNSMMLNQSALMRSASLDNPMKNLKKSECSIIVRDLSFFCNENHLKELVTCYGLCTKIHICRSEESNHRSLLHAFVEMAHEETVYSLIEELHCVVFMGRQLKIQRCHENPEMKEFMNQKVEKMGIQVYVRFESMEDRGHGLVNEERLREVFADCGDIEDAIIQRHSQNLWRQKGYGFIFFLTFEGAELATKNKNGIMYDNVYYQCEYTHKAKEKINAIIATPEQFQFYQVGARGNGPAFPTSAFEVGAAANRLEHPAYASAANSVNVSQREHYSSGNYPYSSQDPAPRGPPVTRTTSFPTINNYSSAPSSDFIPRDRTNEANLPFSSATSVDDQSWNYPTQQPPVTSNSSFRVAAGGGVGAGSNNVSGSSYSSTSWTSNTVAATASQEFIRTSEHYNSESVSSPSYSQLSQQSSQTSYLNNHYSAAQPTPVTTTVPTNGPGYVESIGGGLRENSNNGLLGPSASSSDYGKYQILPPSSTSAVSAASSSTQYQYQQQQQAPRGNIATTAYPSFK